MGIMPTWSIVEDHVVIGSSAELCDLGVKQLAGKDADRKSLLEAEGFKKVAAGLPKDLTGLSYTDSQVQLTQMMMQMQQFWPLVVMYAMQAGVQLPPSLPSLTSIAKDMGPSYRYRYWASDGLHADYRGPGIEVSAVSLAGAGVGAAVALPALAKARENARNAALMADLKQIGVGLALYTQDHEGNWPTTLEQVKSYLGAGGIPEDPRKPRDFRGPSYVYVGGRPKTTDPNSVVLYENPEFCTNQIGVLFGDSHVEVMKPDGFRRAVKATYERLGKEMPEIRFQGETQGQSRVPRPAKSGRSSPK
jgi:hypothetical protein